MNPETVNTILDVMQKELEVEEDRHNFVLSKTNTILTVSSILLAAGSLLIKEFKSELPLIALLILGVGALCLLCSILISLFVIQTARFKRIDFSYLLEELAKDSTEVKSRLIATYDTTIKKYTEILDGKVKIQKCCNLLTITGTILLLISIIIGAIYSLVCTC